MDGNRKVCAMAEEASLAAVLSKRKVFGLKHQINAGYF
jgi:hypothetical protein